MVQAAVADLHVGGEGDGVFRAGRAGQRPVQIPAAGHQWLFHDAALFSPNANAVKVNGKFLAPIVFTVILESDIHLILQTSVIGHPLVNGGLIFVVPEFDGLAVGGVDPFPGFIAGGAVIEPAGHGTVEFRGAVDCHIVTVPEKFGILALRHCKALDPE